MMSSTMPSALMLCNGTTTIDGMSGTRYRDGPADGCAIARLSELSRSDAWFLTPVSRASGDLTQYSCPDRDVNRSSGIDRQAINITIVMQ